MVTNWCTEQQRYFQLMKSSPIQGEMCAACPAVLWCRTAVAVIAKAVLFNPRDTDPGHSVYSFLENLQETSRKKKIVNSRLKIIPQKSTFISKVENHRPKTQDSCGCDSLKLK